MKEDFHDLKDADKPQGLLGSKIFFNESDEGRQGEVLFESLKEDERDLKSNEGSRLKES